MRRFCPVSPSVWLSIVLLGGLQTADAAFERQVTGGRSAGMGSAIVTGSPGVWSASVHSALLVLVDRPSIECQIQPSPFGLSELGRAGIAAALPFGPGTVALSGMRLGGELYQETEIALSVGIRPCQALLLGARLRWCHLSIARYGSASTVAVDVSLAAVPIPEIVLATLIRGINRPTIGESHERLPFDIAMGISYRPSGSMEIAAEWEHDILHDPALNAGVEYAPADILSLRVGIAGAVRSWTCGLGLRYGGLLCDYGLTLHPVLGPAHTISLGFTFE